MTAKYASLEARVLSAYLDSMPDFTPAKDASVSRDEQARFYAFAKGVYARAAENPGILGLTVLHPDDAHPNRFHKSAYGKPKLATDIRKIAGAADAFFGFLAEAGERGTADADGMTLPADFRIPKKYGRAMEAVGLKVAENRITSDKWPGIFRAWKLLSYPCAGEVALRQRSARMEKCAFVENAPGLKGTFARLIGEEAASLAAWLEAHGYARETAIVNKEITVLRYTKNGAGVQFLHDYQAETPAYVALAQREWRMLLPQFGEMGATLKDFVLEYNKKCDGCGYCTQRTKGAGNPYAVAVEKDGEAVRLCPLFPQYSYVFEKLDAKKVAGVIECLRFMENNLPDSTPEKPEDSLRFFHL